MTKTKDKNEQAPKYLVNILGYWTGVYDFEKAKKMVKKKGGEIVASHGGKVLYKKPYK